MRFDVYGFLVGCVIVAFFMPYAVDYYRRTSATPNDALNHIVTCAQGKDPVKCARPYIARALENESAKDLIDEIAASTQGNQCHFLIHVIGQDLFRKTKNVEKAINMCGVKGGICNSACAHGVIGEAFESALGVNGSYDYAHLSADELVKLGAKLCTTDSASGIGANGMCHGVGHALFIASENIDDAAKKCEVVATGSLREDCFRGAFMEYRDEISDFSVWQHSTPIPTIADLRDLCIKKTKEETGACFYYFPSIVRHVYLKAGIDESVRQSLSNRVKPICLALSKVETRRACIFGYALAFNGNIREDTNPGVEGCNDFLLSSDRAACIADISALSGNTNGR